MPQEHTQVLIHVPPEKFGELINLLLEKQVEIPFTFRVVSGTGKPVPPVTAPPAPAPIRPPARRDAVQASLKANETPSVPAPAGRGHPTPRQTSELRHQQPKPTLHVKLLTHSYEGQTFLIAQIGDAIYHRAAILGESPEVQALLFGMDLTETSTRPVMALIDDTYVCKSFNASLTRWNEQGWVNGNGQSIRNAETWSEIYLKQTRLKATGQTFLVRQVDQDARNRSINKKILERFQAGFSEVR